MQKIIWKSEPRVDGKFGFVYAEVNKIQIIIQKDYYNPLDEKTKHFTVTFGKCSLPNKSDFQTLKEAKKYAEEQLKN